MQRKMWKICREIYTEPLGLLANLLQLFRYLYLLLFMVSIYSGNINYILVFKMQHTHTVLSIRKKVTGDVVRTKSDHHYIVSLVLLVFVTKDTRRQDELCTFQ